MNLWGPVSIFIAAAGAIQPASAQRGGDTGPADRCESTDCFNQLQIRNVEVVGQSSLIVYVGGQECPFLVEFNGTFCDLTFLPGFDVVFRPANMARARSTPIVGGIGSDRGGGVEQTRICASDIDMGLVTDPFNSANGGDRGDAGGLSCRIQNVRSLTDDERLELYVDQEMSAPPPPFGTGRVEAPDNPQEPVDGSAGPEDEDLSRRRRDTSDE